MLQLLPKSGSLQRTSVLTPDLGDDQLGGRVRLLAGREQSPLLSPPGYLGARKAWKQIFLLESFLWS